MYRVKADRAQFPAPFEQGLEFNPPVHGTWNIVHIGMMVPESHSIYVCSDNCMRGVVMTAAEMGCMDRFSCVTLSERDLMIDNLETITIEGVSDVIEHLEKRPPIVFVFLVCLHIFVASDEEYILKRLRERYPDICFVRSYMDCVRQKTGPSPDMKLRGFIFEAVKKRDMVPGRVNVLGCDLAYGEGNELLQTLEGYGWKTLQLQNCRSYEEFERLGEAQLNICTYMNAQNGVRTFSGRLGAEYLYLPPAVDYEEIRAEYRLLDEMAEKMGFSRQLCRTLDGERLQDEEYFARQEALCEEALAKLRDCLGDISIAVDYTCHQRPLGLAKLFLSHGIRVKRVYLDAVLDEERPAFDWIQENAPDLELTATIQPEEIRAAGMDNDMDRKEQNSTASGYGLQEDPSGEGSSRKTAVLAMGQKAAWYEQTGYFVNMVESGGLWGYEGIRLLCGKMEEALKAEKNMRDIVPRKGLGWPSLCDLPGSRNVAACNGGAASLAASEGKGGRS